MLRISDLPHPITAAKAHWLAASHWTGFTPANDSPAARAQCTSTIARQAGDGYILEYITQTFGTPNAAFNSHPRSVAERAAHAQLAGKLVAVHRLRSRAHSLAGIIGREDYEDLQDRWDATGQRHRWSVAFPIVESFLISGQPYANAVFNPETMRRLFGYRSKVLRPVDEEARTAIASLQLERRLTSNAWLGIEDEISAAERLPIDARTRTLINQDLADVSMEGLPAEQSAKVRLRAAWLAQKFVLKRRREGNLSCDSCGFNPVLKTIGTSVNPRSLMDVHHKDPLAEGVRYTTLADFALLCPNCHRFVHKLGRHPSGVGYERVS